MTATPTDEPVLAARPALPNRRIDCAKGYFFDPGRLRKTVAGIGDPAKIVALMEREYAVTKVLFVKADAGGWKCRAWVAAREFNAIHARQSAAAASVLTQILEQ